MLEYELNGKIYTEEEINKAAGGKDKAAEFIKSKGYKLVDKKKKSTNKTVPADNGFGEDVYKKTFGFENPKVEQFPELNKTKKKPVSKYNTKEDLIVKNIDKYKKPAYKYPEIPEPEEWTGIITPEELAGEESTVAENISKKLSKYGLMPEETTFGLNRITLRGANKNPLGKKIDMAGNELEIDLEPVVTGKDLSREELEAGAKKLNDYIELYGNKAFIQDAKKKNPTLITKFENAISPKSRTPEQKIKLYTTELETEFKDKEEAVKSKYKLATNEDKAMGINATMTPKVVNLSEKDFDSQEKYNAYKAWKSTGQVPLPNEQKLEKFIGEYNKNYRNAKASEFMSDASQEERVILNALATEKEENAINNAVYLKKTGPELDKKWKDLSAKITEFQKTPQSQEAIEALQKEYLALQNETSAYNSKITETKKDFNSIKAVYDNALKDYNRLSQAGSLLKQTGLSLVGAAADINASIKALAVPGDYTTNKNVIKSTFLEPIYAEQKAAGKELESYQQDLSLKDIKSMKDFGRWGASVLTQMPSSMAMAVTGEAAMPLFFLSGYGSKQYEIATAQEAALSRLKYNNYRLEKGEIDASEMADVQKQIASDKKTLNISEGAKITSQLLAGTSEVLFEKYGTLGIIKETDNILRSIPKQEIKQQLITIGKEMGKSVPVESWTEGLTQFANNFGDIHLLGQDKNYFDGVPDSMAGGAFMGPGFSAMGGIPTIGKNITKAVISEITSKKEFKAREEKLSEIKRLTGLDDITGLTKKEVNKLKLQPPVRKAVEELVDQIDQEDLRILDRLGKDLSIEDAKKIGDLNQKLRKVTKDWEEASKTPGLEDSQLKSLRDYYQKQYNDAFNEREAMLTDEQLAGKNRKENAKKRVMFEATAGSNIYNYRLTRKTYLEKLAGFNQLSSEDKQKYNDLAISELSEGDTDIKLSDDQISNRAKELYAGKEISDQIDRDVQAANDFATESGLNVNVEIINNEKELLAKYGKVLTAEQLKELKAGITNAFNIDASTLAIYKPNAIKNGHVSSGSHEVLHTLLSKAFQNNQEEANKNGIKLLNYLKTAQPDLYASVEERMKAYTPEYFAYGEEVFNALSDSFSDGKIPKDDVFTQISKAIFRITNGKFGSSETFSINNLNTDSGKALFDAIKGYNQKAGAKKTKDGRNIRFIYSNDEDELVEENPNNAGFRASKSKVAEVQQKIDKLEDQFDKDEVDYDTYTNRLEALERDLEKAKLLPEDEPKPAVKKVEVSDEDTDKEIIKNERGSVSSDKVQKIYDEKGLSGAQDIIDLFKPITKKLVNRRMDAPGFDRDLLTDEIETGEGGIIYLIKSYKPEKGVPLAAYINKQLPLRAIAASRRVLDAEFSKDVTEEKGLMAQETVSEAKEKPKYKNALESNVFEPEVLKTMSNKILTQLRTLKSRIDAPISLNRTVTPLISEIRDAMGKQLDIDVKTAMGGKKDGQLVKWLLKNKRYVLENMTTTWLMGANGQGGIPQAIQKRIDGKWVSYPDWVDQKIDRESVSTDNAGRTSGAELVRRLPNVFNNVSDEDYLGQIVGVDGNPIRGRKESLAKAVSEESAFDIINKDLEEEGDIYKALAANQERLGYEVTNAFAAEIAKQAERGNVKQSRTNVSAIDSMSNKFYDFYTGLDTNSRANVLRYLDTRDEKYINDLDPNKKEELLNILNKWQEVYIKNYDKLKEKWINKENGKFKENFYNIDSFDKYILTESEDLKISKSAILETNRAGLDFNEKNAVTIKEIKDTIINDLKIEFGKAKTKEEQKEIINRFLRTYRAIFTGGTVGEKLFKTNSALFDALNKIDGFKELGYKIKKSTITKKGKVTEKSTILDDKDINPTFVSEQSASAGDIAKILQSGKDILVKEPRYNENKKAFDDIISFVDYIKNANMTNKAKAMLIIAFGTSTYSPLRTLGKVDSIILDKNSVDPKDYVWEHVLPVDEMVRGILSYVLDAPIGLNPALTKQGLEALLNESKVSILPRSIDTILGQVLKNKMPSNWKVGEDIYNSRYFDQKTLDYLRAHGINLNPSALTKLTGEGNKIIPVDFEAGKEYIQNQNNIEAVNKSYKPSKTVKGISVFDFDDTVGLTNSNVLYTRPDETVIYHGGSIKELKDIDGVFYAATNKNQAELYAKGNEGDVKSFVIKTNDIVDEEVVMQEIRDLNLKSKDKNYDIEELNLYELIDPNFDTSLSDKDLTKLFNSLKKKGIKAVEFLDMNLDTYKNDIENIVIFDKGIIQEQSKLTGAEFAKQGASLLEQGVTFDFSEFSKVVEGRPGPMVEKMKKMIGKFGSDHFYILTARPADSAVPIHEFLSSIGIDIPLENITGLGNSTAQAKADWMVNKANEGYNDFYFSDDHLPNVTAVKDALDVLDVKSKIQQAKIKFSKTMSDEFNKIIEENTGMEHYKMFSDIVARRRGAKKNKFDFYVPPSAADFELLLYKFMGSGERGEEQKEFFTKALLEPYMNGVDLMDAARQSIKKGYKTLLKSFPGIKDELEKLIPSKDFTYDQAMRVAIWSQFGVEIPGLSERDKIKLTDLVNGDPDLYAFKSGLIAMGKQKNGWVDPSAFWDTDTIVSDLYNITEGAGRKKFLQEFIDNVENIFGKWEAGRLVGPNINKVEAVYGTNVREAIEDSLYRMINGKNRSFGQDKETAMWSSWVNGSTASIMFLNTRSAALQLLGAVNFLNFRDNNPYNAAKAFANQPQYWKDFAHIWNSDKMKERRGGLKEDVAAAEIANSAANSKNKVRSVMAYLLKIGYTPTQLADSFAIASGGAPFYRNRINTYLKQGLTEQEAEKAAWKDFSKVSDETQQSGDPKDISKQQASGAGRLLLVFQNFTMQQARIVKKSVLDLKNGRGDAKTHIAKIAYYLAIQNIMFSTLQQGLFAVLFDDDDDDKKKKEKTDKILGVANGVLDTVIRGTGLAGGVISTIKNVGMKYFEEKDKGFKADYAKVALEAANMSPPIGSKLKKIYSAAQQSKFEKDLIDARGWSIMQDGRVHLGPMYSVTGKLVEASTNVPMDRFVSKIENISQALNSENTTVQRIATGMGFSPWSVGVEETKGDKLIMETAKATRKEEGKIKAEITRKENVKREKDSIRNLPRDEQRRLKLEERKKKREAKLKKREMERKLNRNR